MKEVVFDEYPVVNYRYKGEFRQPSYRELRLALLAKYKNCFWCGVEMNDNIPLEGERADKRLATIDHLASITERGKGGVTQKVLACWKCNNDRAVEQNPNHKT